MTRPETVEVPTVDLAMVVGYVEDVHSIDDGDLCAAARRLSALIPGAEWEPTPEQMKAYYQLRYGGEPSEKFSDSPDRLDLKAAAKVLGVDQ